MQPDNTENQNPQLSGRGAVAPPPRDYQAQQNAVAQMTRAQIDQIYARQAAEEQSTTSTSQQPVSTPVVSQPTPVTERQSADTISQPQSLTQLTDDSSATSSGPYQRTHSDQHSASAAAWKQYHSSWQSYYQKYYERYYVGAVQQVGQRYQKQLDSVRSQAVPASQTDDGTLSKEEAMYDLRTELLGKVKSSAQTVRKSRHFVPLVSAFIVFVIFGFLQYNATIVSYVQAYVSPGNIDPQNIIVNPSASLKVGPEPRLIIPKINVDVGVDYNTKPTNDTNVPGNLIDAMRKDVAYFGGFKGADARPGQLGNFGLSGHSSNEWYTTGSQELKFVFVRLPDMKKGDIFYINYKGTRYTYTVSQTMVVGPNDAGRLNLGYDKPRATLITCVPIGTANSRLFVVGDQISPDPTTSKRPGETTTTQSAPKLTGKDPTLIERLFGAGSN